MAIKITDLNRSFGTGKKQNHVLRDFSMNAEVGTIYGLLGPSGCGKTTLLKSVLGRLKPESGKILVLGELSGSPSCKVPGSAVGYSPQELALYDDLSIRETLLFHGRLQKMSYEKIQERQQWLSDFLDIPASSRTVGKLSGGERRRVSLAVALLHEPDLLLLDEPTVGVDPELRARIWGHLREIADTGTTIVITTHYIDEASQADRVGLMRNGSLLAEDTPDNVMNSQDASSLEEAFLILCKRQPKGVIA